MLNDIKTEYYQKLINENKDDARELFRGINLSLNNTHETPLPSHQNDQVLANEFGEFFTAKIETIRNNIDKTEGEITLEPEEPRFTTPLFEFKLLSLDDTKKLIKSSKSKHCSIDPIPTWLLKDSLDEVLPVITEIINLSLSTGNVPEVLKQAIIKPLLKKRELDLTYTNYRPVSNLSYLSKLIEKAVAMQLTEHLKVNKLLDNYQSAYRKYHSTETALLKVQNDILNELDNKNVVLQVLLDLSVAFDTINHKILLNRLETRYGIQTQYCSIMESLRVRY
jgi:hypothetical protein